MLTCIDLDDILGKFFAFNKLFFVLFLPYHVMFKVLYKF